MLHNMFRARARRNEAPPTSSIAHRVHHERTHSETTIGAASMWQGKSLEGDEDDYLTVIVAPRVPRLEAVFEERKYEEQDFTAVQVDVFGPVRHIAPTMLGHNIGASIRARQYVTTTTTTTTTSTTLTTSKYVCGSSSGLGVSRTSKSAATLDRDLASFDPDNKAPAEEVKMHRSTSFFLGFPSTAVGKGHANEDDSNGSMALTPTEQGQGYRHPDSLTHMRIVGDSPSPAIAVAPSLSASAPVPILCLKMGSPFQLELTELFSPLTLSPSPSHGIPLFTANTITTPDPAVAVGGPSDMSVLVTRLEALQAENDKLRQVISARVVTVGSQPTAYSTASSASARDSTVQVVPAAAQEARLVELDAENHTGTDTRATEVRDSSESRQRHRYQDKGEVEIGESMGEQDEEDEAGGSPCSYVSGSTMHSASVIQTHSRTRSTTSAAQIRYLTAQVEFLQAQVAAARLDAVVARSRDGAADVGTNQTGTGCGYVCRPRHGDGNGQGTAGTGAHLDVIFESEERD